jgi:hypothetical protein
MTGAEPGAMPVRVNALADLEPVVLCLDSQVFGPGGGLGMVEKVNKD